MGPKTVNIRSICNRLDLPVEEVSGEGGSMLGTFHWVMITSGGGGRWLVLFSFPMQPGDQQPRRYSPLGRRLLTPPYFSLATTDPTYLEARVYTRPYLL